MRIYIAGPIAGRPDLNRPAFAEAVAMLQEIGHEPISPLTDVNHDRHLDHWWMPGCFGKGTGRPDDIHGYGCYLLADILALAECEAIFLLRDWYLSPGARAEFAFASACGMTVMQQEEVEHWWAKEQTDQRPGEVPR